VLTALTREVSEALGACELTHLTRAPIDIERARAQHAAYERALAVAGCQVERLTSDPTMPDAVFIEDSAVVFDEVAIVTRPGAASRRAETEAVAQALALYRPVKSIQTPGTVDGGDVLVVGRRLFVGRSTRTNDDAIAQMHQILAPFGYTVCAVPVRGCLHLKSAVTALTDNLLLANPEWIDKGLFSTFGFVDVDPLEPMAANALRIGERIIYPIVFPRTAERIAGHGLQLHTIDVSELAKAEGAVTCCSLIVNS